nr:cell division protein SepF [Angustibacter aerolatus]
MTTPATRSPGDAGCRTAPSPGCTSPTTASLRRITTIHPRTYNEAKTIGEAFRQGVPVIMNLSDMDDADAKRLVDFAAGLVFGLHGAIERVTSKVFLLSPAHVEVLTEDKQPVAPSGLFNQSLSRGGRPGDPVVDRPDLLPAADRAPGARLGADAGPRVAPARPAARGGRGRVLGHRPAAARHPQGGPAAADRPDPGSTSRSSSCSSSSCCCARCWRRAG